MKNGKMDIIFAGVGGQGSVAVSHLLAEAAIETGYNVKLTETFGAAVRGGSVYSAVRLGEVWSPLPGTGKVNALVGLEPLEAMRVGLEYLSPDGWVVLNQAPLYPVDVSVGRVTYPAFEEIQDAMRQISAGLLTLNATRIAETLGNTRMMNMVMLGALMALDLLEIEAQVIFERIDRRWEPDLAEANKKAYQKGYELGQDQLQGIKVPIKA
jgi:indolepyruvate ferredoxin oxidoreductase beta subunit